jgi:hypothetical protein
MKRRESCSCCNNQHFKEHFAGGIPSLIGSIPQLLPLLSAPFVLGGVLKIEYDIAIYFNFRNIKPKEENSSGYSA